MRPSSCRISTSESRLITSVWTMDINAILSLKRESHTWWTLNAWLSYIKHCSAVLGHRCYRILPPGSSFVICLATETDRRQADFVGGGKGEFPKMELQRVPRNSNTDASTYLLDPGFRTPDSTRNQGKRRLTSLVHAVDILSILGQKPKPNESQCGIFQYRH